MTPLLYNNNQPGIDWPIGRKVFVYGRKDGYAQSGDHKV